MPTSGVSGMPVDWPVTMFAVPVLELDQVVGVLLVVDVDYLDVEVRVERQLGQLARELEVQPVIDRHPRRVLLAFDDATREWPRFRSDPCVPLGERVYSSGV